MNGKPALFGIAAAIGTYVLIWFRAYNGQHDLWDAEPFRSDRGGGIRRDGGVFAYSIG